MLVLDDELGNCSGRMKRLLGGKPVFRIVMPDASLTKFLQEGSHKEEMKLSQHILSWILYVTIKVVELDYHFP